MTNAPRPLPRFICRSLTAFALIAAAGCAPGTGSEGETGTGASSAGVTASVISNPDEAATSAVALNVTEVATGLSFPWGAAFLPDGRLLVTERDGRLRLIENGALNPTAITGLPPVFVNGQGGMFDVVAHPDFANNGLIYVSFAAGTQAENRTTVIRGKLEGTALTNVERVFQASPGKRGGAHFGGRMMFLPDSTLMLTLGDGYSYRDKAQDLSSHLGKIVRMNDRGAAVEDAPYAIGENASPFVHSYGHRNVQGIARDPASGTIYAHEHGPKGGDEINMIKSGANYGWPVITYGVDYSGLPISLETAKDGMEQPLLAWVPSIAPSGMIFYTGDMFPAWKGDLIVSLLAGQHLRRVDLESGQVVGQETMLSDRGERYRAVIQAPDGALIALTDAPDGKVLRITPAD